MTRFITLAEFWWLAEQVTGINAEVLGKSGSHNLADSALHAPQASFGGLDFSPIDRQSSCACMPHVVETPTARRQQESEWACLVTFLDLNDFVWEPDPPDVDEAESAILTLAEHEVDETWFANWLRQRTRQAGR